MRSTKEVTGIILHKERTPKLEVIIEFPISELIANGGKMETFRAYTNPNGNDINSLKSEIINKEGCSIEEGASITSFKYDITKKVAILRLDRSRILPHKDKGYIHIKVSGNYKFEQIVKLQWTVHKEVPTITTDWIKIEKNKEPIIWETGKVFVSKLTLLLPPNILNNIVWYRIPSLSIKISGKDKEKYILEPIKLSEESCNSEYNLYFKCKCQDTIKESISKDIELSLWADNKAVKSKKMSIEFQPAKRIVEPELIFCTTEYELGAQNTQLAKLKLSCKSNDIAAIAKVKVSIECNGEIVECDQNEVEILTSTPQTVNIKMIREKLTKLPANDIEVEVVVESCDQYTEVSNFSGVFKLTI